MVPGLEMGAPVGRFWRCRVIHRRRGAPRHLLAPVSLGRRALAQRFVAPRAADAISLEAPTSVDNRPLASRRNPAGDGTPSRSRLARWAVVTLRRPSRLDSRAAPLRGPICKVGNRGTGFGNGVWWRCIVLMGERHSSPPSGACVALAGVSRFRDRRKTAAQLAWDLDRWPTGCLACREALKEVAAPWPTG